MFSQIPVKLIIYCIILAAIIAGCYSLHDAIKQSGYDERVAEESKAFRDKVAAITKAHTEELAKATHEAEHFRQVAVILQNAEPIVITKWKEKVIYANPNCTKLDGFGVMWNNSLERFNL